MSSRWPGSRTRRTAVLAATTLATLTLLAPGTAPAGGIVDAAAGRIVYVDGGDIYSIAPDGTDVRQLTDDPADDLQPRVSPNGHEIAFVSERDGNREIYVMAHDGSDQRRLTTDPRPDEYPIWSPLGTTIVFERGHEFDQGYGPEFAWELFAVTPVDSSVRRLTTNPTGNDFTPSFSPDGQSVVFARIELARLQAYWIASVGLDGGEMTYLSEVGGEDLSPAWGPSGEIAYVSYQDGIDEIWLVRPDRTGRRPLVTGFAATARPVWSDSGIIAFNARETPSSDWTLHTVNPTNDAIDKIGSGVLLTWGPTGAEILIEIDGELAVQDQWGYYPPRPLGVPGPDGDWGRAPVPTCGGRPGTIFGGFGDDRLQGTTGSDVIVDPGGDDVIFGGDGDDLICSGPGHDRVHGNRGNDRVWAGPGDDTVWAGEGDDVVWGGADDDTVYGHSGEDVIGGGPGADHLEGGTDRDVVGGGGGTDTCADRMDLRWLCEVLID